MDQACCLPQQYGGVNDSTSCKAPRSFPNTEGAPRKTVTWCLTTNNASQFGRQFAKHQLITDHHRTLSVCIVLLIYPLIELNLVAQ